MDNITLGQIQNWLIWGIGFVGAVSTIVKSVKKAISEGFKPIERKIDTVDKNATMNYLMQTIAEIDRNGGIDGAGKKHFYAQYEHYTTELKGNTYIKDEVERLKREKKL